MSLLLPLLVLSAAPALADEIVFPLDPVELVHGSEVAGDEAHALERGRFEYRFASAESQAVFEADPASYEIQLGGGCARMGPLSGVGDPGIYTVYDGRIFLFASEGCREGFLATPEKLLPRADPRPEPSEAARDRGLAILRRALDGMGGTRAIDAVRTYSQRFAERQEHDGALYDVGDSLHVDYVMSGVTLTRWWGDWQNDAMVSTERSFMEDGEDSFEMHASQVEAVRRRARVLPLSVLKARKRTDFIAWVAGEETHGDETLDLLGCWFEGTQVVLAVDAKGLVRSARFQERGWDSAFWEMRVDFSDYETQAGVPIAKTHTATCDGKPYPRGTRTLTKVSVESEQ